MVADMEVMEETVVIEIIVVMVGTEVETEVALMGILIEEPSFHLFVRFVCFNYWSRILTRMRKNRDRRFEAFSIIRLLSGLIQCLGGSFFHVKLCLICRKKQNVIEEPTYYDSDAIYRNQSIYGGAPIYQQPSLASGGTAYVPPTVYYIVSNLLEYSGYQPPTPYSEQRPAEVGYRPPLFPGSAELAEIAPEPVKEEPKKESVGLGVNLCFILRERLY